MFHQLNTYELIKMHCFLKFLGKYLDFVVFWFGFFKFLFCFYLFANFELLGGQHRDLQRHKEESALANKSNKMTQHELHHFAVLYVLLLT